MISAMFFAFSVSSSGFSVSCETGSDAGIGSSKYLLFSSLSSVSSSLITTGVACIVGRWIEEKSCGDFGGMIRLLLKRAIPFPRTSARSTDPRMRDAWDEEGTLGVMWRGLTFGTGTPVC